MVPIEHNLVGKYHVPIGIDRMFKLTFPSEMGDMTGYSFVGEVRSKVGNSLIMDLSLNFNGTTRVLTIKLLGIDMVTLGVVQGMGNYDILMLNESMVPIGVVVKGEVEFKRTVTAG